MLQRAASNAYSWWWASHIRTKQSKWLEQCLQDMEEKVKRILKIIDDDGDSFAKRAEMYYKRRPELISSVEEAFKSFRALADRYDLLSKDLQNANHTIATVFPEQVQFGIGEDDDFPFPKNPPSAAAIAAGAGKPNFPVPTIPEAPPPHPDWKPTPIPPATASPRAALPPPSPFKSKRSSEGENQPKSGLSKEEALEEIKKLQKEILALQTVKEFIKSSYENGVTKYWEIENQIMDMQHRVLELQDEFNVGAVIEDDEARTLMAEAALKTCEETLTMLQDKQDKLISEARQEYTRIETACNRVKSLRDKYLDDDPDAGAGENSGKDVTQLIVQETKAIEASTPPSEKPNKDSADSVTAIMAVNITVSQMVEKIDHLVNKVLSLETAVSTHNALVDMLTRQADELHAQIHRLEDEKSTLIEDAAALRMKVKEMEEKLSNLHDLNRNVESQHIDIQKDMVEARSSLGNLSGQVSGVKLEDETEESESQDNLEEVAKSEEKVEDKVEDDGDNKDVVAQVDEDAKSFVTASDIDSMKIEESKPEVLPEPESKTELEPESKTELEPKTEPETEQLRKETKKTASSIHPIPPPEKVESEKPAAARSEDMSWQQILLSGVEDRETILLKEYTAILRNYKDLKRKLHEMEKKETDAQFNETLRMRELRKAILKRDQEIQILRRHLQSSLQDGEDIESILETDNDKMTEEITFEKLPSLTKSELKIRSDIDAILEENLDFWLKFSTAYHQVRKFKTEVDDLQNEAWKLKEKRKPDGSSSSHLKSDVRAIRNHLREIQTKLSVWLDQNVSLKDELENRSASLQSVQDELGKALGENGEEEEIQFSSLQAAKLQGEIVSLQQENNKVREELQTCLDHVKILRLEIDKSIRQLSEDFGISEQLENASKMRIPLRAFLFGSKAKKHKASSASSSSSTSSSIFSRKSNTNNNTSKRHEVIKSDADVHMASQ
ncbi:kinase-interacting protein 1-like [Andrographis paniculata]|uniref:kinase-interacting protein 1-like n=1 Tax=Andrographis paniculata TaxID=175694 RepID=UPI0021E8C615|nr:kinase-interacting protein 1-like [Andrographis paniculata]